MKAPGEVLRIEQVTLSYWRAVFDNPPLNVIDGTVLTALSELAGWIEADDQANVVVTANDDYFLAHLDMTGESTTVTRTLGPTGLPITTDIFTAHPPSPSPRFAGVPVVSAAMPRS